MFDKAESNVLDMIWYDIDIFTLHRSLSSLRSFGVQIGEVSSEAFVVTSLQILEFY